jgi:hypothetical protein
VRVPNSGIPQRYVVRTVEGDGDDAVVTGRILDAENDASFVIDRPTTVVVGALSPATSQPARFTLSAERP